MHATYRVKNSSDETVGFIVDNHFMNNTRVRESIGNIDNLRLLKNGVIRIKQNKQTLPNAQYVDIITRKQYKRIVKENPLKRDIADAFKKWKQSNYKYILQVKGARQIGKTTEILKFAYGNYENVLYVNLVNDAYGFKDCLKQNIVHIELSNYCERANLPKFDNSRNTIIVIDEVQENVNVFNALRTLRAEVACDIIITGSYLGTLVVNFTKEHDKSVFFPMGTVTPITMFPMSFKEFCRAFDKESLLMNVDIYGNSKRKDYNQLQELYDIYINIGGYPAVVNEYKETKNISDCYDLVGSLLTTFKRETARYFTDSKQLTAFELVFEQAVIEMLTEKRGNGKRLVEDITEFVNTNAKGYLTRTEVSNAITWLIECNMVATCAMVNGKDFINQQPDRRLYFMDCGIASYLLSNSRLDVSAKRGLQAETFAFCELMRLYYTSESNKKVKDRLCFSLYNQYELDFMLVGKGGNIDNKIFGIEIKANDGEPKSLKVYIKDKLVDKAVLAENTPGGKGEAFDTIPIYTVGVRFPYK